jgi:hypothetical protein
MKLRICKRYNLENNNWKTINMRELKKGDIYILFKNQMICHMFQIIKEIIYQ